MESTETQITSTSLQNQQQTFQRAEPTRVGSIQGADNSQDRRIISDSFIKQRQTEDSKSTMITIQESKAESFLQTMEQCLTDLADYKELIEKNVNTELNKLTNFRSETLQSINELSTQTKELNSKIGNVKNYEDYIRSELEQDTLKKDKTSLQLHLIEQEKKITDFIENMTTSTSNAIAKLSGEVTNVNLAVNTVVSKLDTKITELKSVETIITESLKSFEQQVTNKIDTLNPLQKESLKQLTESVENLTTETSQTFIDGSAQQFSDLKTKAQKMIDDYTKQCQKNLDTIKEESIDFLKSCQKHNTEILKKIPYKDSGKYKIKDWILYGICIFTLLFSTFMNFNVPQLLKN